MKSKRMEKNRKNSGNGGFRSRRIPSRAVHGWTEGVETRRWCGIAHRNTPSASGTREGEEIVHAGSEFGESGGQFSEAPRSALAFPLTSQMTGGIPHMKTKLILILTVLLAGCNLAIAQSPYATRLPAELQTAQMGSLADVTWLQGTTPATSSRSGESQSLTGTPCLWKLTDL